MTIATITLSGWTHVHTYRESHGDHVTEIYQQNPTNEHTRRPPVVLEVTDYRDGRPTRVCLATDQFQRDYLLAAEIRLNEAGRWRPVGKRSISPCYTSGHESFEDATGDRWRIFGAAGHGEWAFRISSSD